MRAAIRPAHRSRRWLRPLLALLVATLPGCGSPALKVDLVGRVESTSGAPMSGVLVHAGSTLTTAATDGSFEIPDVTVPYTLTVASTIGSDWVHAFTGLTSATPVVVPQRFDMAGVTATLSGDVWGGAPVPAGHRVALCVEGLDVSVWGCDIAEEGDVTYSLGVVWSATVAADVRLHALYMGVDGSGIPTGFSGARHVDAAVVDGGVTDVDLSPALLIGSGPLVPVTIDAGNGIIAAVVIAVRMSPELMHTVYRGGWSGGTVDVRMPPAGVADAYQVSAWVQYPSGLVAFAWAVEDGGAAIDLVVPPTPQLLTPANDAVGVTSATPFGVAAGGAVAHTFSWSPTGGTVGPRVWLTTAGTGSTLPDVDVVGMSYPAGGTYAWAVSGLVAPDYEAAVAMRVDYYQLYGFGGPGQTAGGGLAQSEERDLTLAP